MSRSSWDEALTDILIITALPAINLCKEELKYSALPGHSKFRNNPGMPNHEVAIELIKNHFNADSMDSYKGLNYHDATFTKNFENSSMKIVCEYTPAGGPVTVKIFLKFNWRIRSNLPSPSISRKDDKTDTENLRRLVNIATLGLPSRTLAKVFEDSFDWKYIRKGMPFEGATDLSHDKYESDENYSELTRIPAKIFVYDGPRMEIELLIREWE